MTFPPGPEQADATPARDADGCPASPPRTVDPAALELVSRISHELRTPLNSMLGFAQLLALDAPRLEPAQRDKVQRILDAGQLLLGLVDEMLQFARIESGRLALRMQPIELHRAAHEVVELQRPLADAAGLALRLDDASPPGTPPACAWGDARRVREVLANLLSNALKYNRPGGWVVVRVGGDGCRAWVDVEDGGIGLEAWQIERLYEPFGRLGAERTDVPGHGLGLSIARTLALAMGGAIEVDSKPGRGSRFRLVLRVPDSGG